MPRSCPWLKVISPAYHIRSMVVVTIFQLTRMKTISTFQVFFFPNRPTKFSFIEKNVPETQGLLIERYLSNCTNTYPSPCACTPASCSPSARSPQSPHSHHYSQHTHHQKPQGQGIGLDNWSLQILSYINFSLHSASCKAL